MDVGDIGRAWPVYREWPSLDATQQLPPEGIWLFEGDKLLLGSCIYPSPGFMLVTGVITNPELSEAGEVRALEFFLKVLAAHVLVTRRVPFIDMVWTVDKDGVLTRRLPTFPGMHIIAETEIPSPGTAEDSDGGGETGPAKGLEAAPTTVASSVESAPKEPKKSKAKKKASKRKAGEKK